MPCKHLAALVLSGSDGTHSEGCNRCWAIVLQHSVSVLYLHNRDSIMKKDMWLAFCISLLAFAGCNRGKAVDASGNPSPAVIAPAVQELTLPAGTSMRVRLDEAIDTRRNRAGDRFTATLEEPLVANDRVAVPRGTKFFGHVTQSKPSGRFRGRAVIALKLDSFELNGQTNEIRSTSSARSSSGHKKHHLLWIGGGSGGGAAVGAIAGGGTGALIGAGAGAAAGTIGSAITGKRQVSLPAESLLTFTLKEPAEIGRSRS